MKAVEFPQVNVYLGGKQYEYRTLPACRVDEDGRKGNRYVACFELDTKEVESIIKHRKIWYQQMTFGRLFRPMKIDVEKNIFSSDKDTTPLPYVEHAKALPLKLSWRDKLKLLFGGKLVVEVSTRITGYAREIDIKEEGKYIL